MVAAAARLEPVGVRQLAAAARLHHEDRTARPDAIVSIATMEGVWFAYDAATGAPIWQRVKVIDNVEHPAPQAGAAGRRLPLVARRPQLLAGVVRPADGLRLQRRRRDGVRARAADPGRSRSGRRLLGGDTSQGLVERRLRAVPPERLEGLRLGERDQRRERAAGLEVPDAPARARRPDDDRRRHRLRRRRRRQHPCLRREDREGALDVPDRLPDRRRAVGLLRRRHGVRRDRASAARRPVLERRHRRRRRSRCSRSAAATAESNPPANLAARQTSR